MAFIGLSSSNPPICFPLAIGVALGLFYSIRELNDFLYVNKICSSCLSKDKEEKQQKLDSIKNNIENSKKIQPSYIETIKHARSVMDTTLALKYYEDIFSALSSKSSLSDNEIAFLDKLQLTLELNDEQTNRALAIQPFEYKNEIKKHGLPKIKLTLEGSSQPILYSDETIHFAAKAELLEHRTVYAGYEGGSHGVSVRIAKGVSYRVGSYKGKPIYQKTLETQGSGVLIITNKRVLFHPASSNKIVAIPLAKILSFRTGCDNFTIFKDGREKGYIFELVDASPKTAEITLSFLLNRNNKND